MQALRLCLAHSMALFPGNEREEGREREKRKKSHSLQLELHTKIVATTQKAKRHNTKEQTHIHIQYIWIIGLQIMSEEAKIFLFVLFSLLSAVCAVSYPE